MNCPETIRCFKCNHDMAKGDYYIGESSNIWPIGQIYHCDFCRESVGVTADGRITYWTGEVIGHLPTEKEKDSFRLCPKCQKDLNKFMFRQIP